MFKNPGKTPIFTKNFTIVNTFYDPSKLWYDEDTRPLPVFERDLEGI